MIHKVLAILEGAAGWRKLILILAAIHAVALHKETRDAAATVQNGLRDDGK